MTLDPIQTTVQPLLYAKFKGGQFHRAGVDHCSNIMQAAIDFKDMGTTKTQHIRGMSTSKILAVASDAQAAAVMPLILGLGRWTTQKTFDDNYRGEVRGSWDSVPDSMITNAQQLLRWGFKPEVPRGMTPETFMLPHTHWVSQSIVGFGKIVSFDSGVYLVRQHGKDSEFTHYELMNKVAWTITNY